MSKEELKVLEPETQEEAVEEVIERPYTLRKLANGDLWKVLSIMKKILPEDMAKIVVKFITGEMPIKSAGYMVTMNIVTEIIKNLDKAQTEVDEFCADLIGVSVEELNNNYDFGTTPMIVMDVVMNSKNVPFFKVLSKFFS